ncbi:MAG: YidC/Oxa1 family rane protein insertase [Miltoncostaeaceae bacterium]|nr:YidC/Oxa1 family rane protein insertase [Miltoncostaeaceae bacterium]
MNPLHLLERPLHALLEFLHENAGLSWGWSIVVLTVIVRSLLLPLVIKQYRSMRRLQEVAPELKEIQAKYKGDRKKQQEKLMEFYQEKEVNPFASCLPLVAQIPIFLALYYTLKGSADEFVDGTPLSFMWVIPNITQQLTDIGWGAFVVLAIYGLSQLLSTELSATPGMPEIQRRLFRVMPLLIVFFVWQFPVPAGLVLYWMTTNVWTAGQQLVMRHKIGLHIAQLPSDAGKKGSRTPSKVPTATALVEETPEPEARSTPRKRRRGGRRPDEADGGAEVTLAEAVEAPEPQQAPEAREAPEAPEAPALEPAAEANGAGDGADAAEPASAGARPAGGRRQPRPKDAGRPARPASANRKTAKKKR